MEVVVNDREALARRELIQQIALELLRSWGFYTEQLKHLFAGHHSGGQPRKQDELEDAVLDAFAALWKELQSGKIRRIGRETVRYRLIEALRRRGFDRRPYTTHELLVGIATSHRAQTRQRYLRWAKYELQEELGKRFAASFGISDHPSLEGLSDYFLAEFVSRQYELLDGSSSQSGSLLDRLCAAFSGSSDHRRRACQYCPWITPVCPRLGFRQEVPQHELENYAWTTFAEQPEYEACVALERLRYQDRLVRCHCPDDRLAHFLIDLGDPGRAAASGALPDLRSAQARVAPRADRFKGVYDLCFQPLPRRRARQATSGRSPGAGDPGYDSGMPVQLGGGLSSVSRWPSSRRLYDQASHRARPQPDRTSIGLRQR